MGCFNVLCCISDMVICDGDEIVMFNLSQRGSTTLWGIDDYPEFGQYNDYGRILNGNLQKDAGSVYIHKAVWDHAIDVGKKHFLPTEDIEFVENMSSRIVGLRERWLDLKDAPLSLSDLYEFQGMMWHGGGEFDSFSYLLKDEYPNGYGWNPMSRDFRHSIRLEIIAIWDSEVSVAELSKKLSDIYYFLTGVAFLNKEVKPTGYVRIPGQCYLSKEEVDVSVDFHNMCANFQKTRPSQCEEEE